MLTPPIPVGWFEFWCSYRSPYLYALVPAAYGTTINAAANQVGAASNPNIQPAEPFYWFSPQSSGFTPPPAGFAKVAGYRIQFTRNDLNFFGGRWLAETITGDSLVTRQMMVWNWPIELNKNDQLAVVIDNLTAAALQVDVVALGYAERIRDRALSPLELDAWFDALGIPPDVKARIRAKLGPV
jgi:hypothetical protein